LFNDKEIEFTLFSIILLERNPISYFTLKKKGKGGQY